MLVAGKDTSGGDVSTMSWFVDSKAIMSRLVTTSWLSVGLWDGVESDGGVPALPSPWVVWVVAV